jgi:acyl-CoA hydrolase
MARSGREIALEAICWPDWVRAGDLVAWGQASAEPVGLTASLMTARAEIGRFRAFVGICCASSVDPAHADHVAFASYCGTGTNRHLGARLDILPVHYSQLAGTLGREAPVVLLSLAPGADPDHFSYGAAGDYIVDLIDHARLVIAEVSEHMPWTGRGAELRRDEIDLVVRSCSVPPAPAAVRFGPVEQAIAQHVAALVEDGSTLQIGLGGIPAAVLRALDRHRNLGIHSGLIGDELVELAERGVVNNAAKTIDPGLTVTGLLAGGARLMRWADRNPTLALRPTRYTHDHAVLTSIDRLVALNSAIEVDLTGQVNAEIADGRYLGAVGGAGSFLRGAQASKGGLPIIALPATAGAKSRIVTRLSGPVSTARADAGLFVTEHGIADLRGLSLRARRERMLGIADPGHRASLEAELALLPW